MLGEKASTEGGPRTATVTAVTNVKVAITTPDTLKSTDLIELSAIHTSDEDDEA